MGMSVVPMVSPVIGGLLDELYGWHAAFLLVLAFGVVALAEVHIDLVETNRSASTSFAAQFRAYPELLGSRRFWGYAMTAALSSGAFFAFLGGGPFVATEMLGLSPSGYGLYFGIVSIGYMLGNFVSGRYSRRIGINRMMLMGNVVASFGMMLAIALFAAGQTHPLSLFGPVFFTGTGNGMTLPNANAGMVSVRPQLAGSASGLGGTLQIGGGAALAALAGALLHEQSGPMPLLWIMLLCSTGGLLATLYVISVARRAGDAA
jgi:DHA1 family bicyclomycin/chloramphenicol resistance-like MFS transporter